MKFEKHNARLIDATFHDCEKVTVQRDPNHDCIVIKLTGNSYASTHIHVFANISAMPELIVLEDAVEEDETDDEQTPAA